MSELSVIRINDIFDELTEENEKLRTDLYFANKCIQILEKFKFYLNLIKSEEVFDSKLDPKQRQELIDLEIKYNFRFVF